MGPDPATVVRTIFARRLAPDGPAPVAVAVSGGGDSLALLLLAADWARDAGRRLLVLSVDHGLRAEGAQWSARVGENAAALGADFHALSWAGEKPRTGLPAAARAARHALLADAAREAGARVIAMGHTADDLAESALMRAEGSTNPDPREWSASPAWPQGRGVFILRPLLSVRRGALRDLLAARGADWIEDPANIDLTYARARARKQLAGALPPAAKAPKASDAEPVIFHTDPASGEIVLARNASSLAIAAACLCAAGTDRPPRGAKLARLTERLAERQDFVATLAGARIEAVGERVRICRDAGETARGGLAPMALTPCATTVWDGRYELTTATRGLSVRPLKGLAARLSPVEKQRLLTLPVSARAGLPAVVNLSGTMICPILAETSDVRIRVLSGERFGAAIGLVDSESRA